MCEVKDVLAALLSVSLYNPFFKKSAVLAPQALLGHLSFCTKDLLPSSWTDRHSPAVPLSAQLSGLQQPAHRRLIFTKHTQAMSGAPVCLPRTAEETNQAGIQSQQSQDCGAVPLWRDWSSWRAPLVPVALLICPTVPRICSALCSVSGTTCYTPTLRLAIPIHKQLTLHLLPQASSMTS